MQPQPDSRNISIRAETLLRNGQLDEAVQVLGAHLRDYPQDVRSRTFLFELLCFQADYDRARKHLALLADSGKEAAVGALLLEGAIHAEQIRLGMFTRDEYPPPQREGATRISGVLNGKPFSSLSDADPRIGARLEVFAAGDYIWLPFHQIAAIELPPPTRLRDLLWAPGVVRMQAGTGERELGELLLPVLTPLTFRHPDGEVRMGHLTEWCRDEHGVERPYGQKMLLVDGEEFPLLEVRKLDVTPSTTGE